MTARVEPGRQPSLWRNPDFRRLWGGDVVSQLGSEITLFVMPLVLVSVLDATGTQVGLLTALYTLPFLVLPLLVGVWQERTARRPVMIVSDLLRFVLVLSVPVAGLVGGLSMAHVYVVAFLVGSLAVVYDIASTSYVPLLIRRDQLGSANSKLTADQTLGATLGPGVGGWLAGALGAANALFLDALSYLVSATMLARIRQPEPPPAEIPPQKTSLQLREGLRSVFSNPPLRSIAIHAAIYNAGGELVSIGFLVYHLRDLQMGNFSLGLVMALGGVGGIAGALSIPLLFDRIGLGPSMLVALVFSTSAYWYPTCKSSTNTATALSSYGLAASGTRTAGSRISVPDSDTLA